MFPSFHNLPKGERKEEKNAYFLHDHVQVPSNFPSSGAFSFMTMIRSQMEERKKENIKGDRNALHCKKIRYGYEGV